MNPPVTSLFEYADFRKFLEEYVSSNGIDWSARPVAAPGTDNYFRSVIWTGEQVVAVGNRGRVAISLDHGDTWTVNDTEATALNAIVWTGNQLVAVGDDGVILTSP